MKFKAGDCVSTRGMTKEQHTQVCRWFIDSGAEPVEDATYRSWQEYSYVGWAVTGGVLLHLEQQTRYAFNPTIYTVDDLFPKKEATQTLSTGITQVFTTGDGIYFNTPEEAHEHMKTKDIYCELDNLLSSYVNKDNIEECCALLLKKFTITKKE